MLKLNEVVNVHIRNYVDFDKWILTEEKVIDFLNNLTYNDIELDEFNYFKIPGYNETIRTLIYVDSYDTIIININAIF